MEDTPEPIKIFVVEDDPVYIKLLQYVAELNPDHIVKVFDTGRACIDHLHENPTVITLDYSLPDITGAEVLRSIKAYNSEIPVILVSSQESINTAVELLKQGAYDYIPKDNDTRDRLLNAINNAKNQANLKEEIVQLREEVIHKYDFEKSIIGESPAIKRVFKLLAKAVKTNITVTITGETGTGKEVVAKENKLGKIKISKEAQSKLQSYTFPGNVRELKSIIDLAAVMCEDNLIEEEDITFNSLKKENELLFQEMSLRDYNFKIIRHFLNKYDNNVLKVADKLDIGKSSIYRYLKEMDEEGF